MKINKCTKLVCNLQDKENYSVPVLALKQALNHGWKLTKVHRRRTFEEEQSAFEEEKEHLKKSIQSRTWHDKNIQSNAMYR